MKNIIVLDKISKSFIIRETFPGILGAVKGLFCAKNQKTFAVRNLSFQVKTGERLAFIGPNGAGKSTTIKMLTGILYPTSGYVEVLGCIPWKSRKSLGFHIGTIFGQRSQLWYNLPPLETFMVLSKIYDIEKKIYINRLQELTKIFEISDFLQKPVRQLSLGERMRCELVASLLHNPQILFLDEPTIGLDIHAKQMIRDLLKKLSHEYGTTLFLTSHDTTDIEAVCDRVIILDKGTSIMDTSLKELKKSFLKKKFLSLVTENKYINLQLPGVKILERTPYNFFCEIDLDISPIHFVVQEILKLTNIKDVTIQDPPMEKIIQNLYEQRK
jgi:ABC-2 type transport system ATP-binding protein